MKKFRWIALFLASVMAVSLLAACSGDGAQTAPEEEIDMSEYTNSSILGFGGSNDGSADISEAIRKANASLKETEALYFPAGTYQVSQSVEITCPVRMDGNVSVNVAAGTTLTVSGPMEAGNQKIFLGDGTVSITSPHTWGYPAWVDNGGMNAAEVLQKAVNSIRCIYVSDLGYRLTGIRISKPTHLKGVGGMQVPLDLVDNTQTVFTIASSDVTLENFKIQMKDASEDSVCFYFDTQKTSMENIRIENVDVHYGNCVVKDGESDENWVDNALFSGLTAHQTTNVPLILTDFRKGNKLVEVSILRRTSQGGNCDVAGIEVENAEDMVFEHFDVNGDVSHQEENGHGMVFRNCKGVKLYRCLMEYLGGSGFIVENCEDFYWENTEVYTFYNIGYDIKGLKNSTFNSVKIYYTSANEGYVFKARDNMILKDCQNLTINSFISSGARDAALSMQGCKDVTVNAYQTLYHKGAALRDDGGNTNVNFYGVQVMNGNSNSIQLKDKGITIHNEILG